MTKHWLSQAFIVSSLILASANAFGAKPEVPEPFRGFDPASKYHIKYDDLDYILKRSVVDVGRSDRAKAEAAVAPTGSRMKAKVNRSTAKEGNRFNFEMYKDNDEARQLLLNIQKDLEELPTEAPLKYFNRDDQLAYWLNLYNVTLINQIIKVYPEHKLKKLLTGRHSILSEKLLKVAGVPLSLDDIEYTILAQNYDHDPLIIYGLYQGIVGGPNIRKVAYNSINVRRLLQDNAAEFINSNRGTYSQSDSLFRASSLYDRNRDFFPDFQTDLRKHLLVFLQNPERSELEAAKKIRPDIDDWTITDLYSSMPRIGGSFASNSAALLDATRSSSESGEQQPVQAGGGVAGEQQTVQAGAVAAPSSAASARIIANSSAANYVNPELLIYMHELKSKQEQSNSEKGRVTVEELGEAPDKSKPDGESKDKDREND
ncbi:MAG: DUF547 domain-containing protein [Lysobacterales bacterium]|jgi:hypothetical protein